MPRQNAARSIFAERSVAERVTLERERHNMSVEGLAKRMEQVGCPIQVSALYRIEKGEPPRRITVDEMVAFATVFNIKVEELMLPINVVNEKAAQKLMLEMEDVQLQMNRAHLYAYTWCLDLIKLTKSNPGVFSGTVIDDLSRSLAVEAADKSDIPGWVQEQTVWALVNTLKYVAEAAGDDPLEAVVATAKKQPSKRAAKGSR